ncbi:MAG: GTP cyclohydrolase I [Pseudonocardiaceae bacterium]
MSEHVVVVGVDGSPASYTASVRHRSLRVVLSRGEVDLPAAERAVADLLVALGKDPTSEQLSDTPRRVAQSYAELLIPREFDLTTFLNDEGPRMPVGLAVGAVTAEGRLHLVFRYRHPLFGPAEAADFANRYLTALDQVTAHDGPTSPADRSAIQRCGGLRASSPYRHTPDRPQAPGRSPHHSPVIRPGAR